MTAKLCAACYGEGMNERVVIDSAVCHGQPCIKGTRIMVSNILNLLAHGAGVEEVLQGYPQLAREDVLAALEYAEALVRDEEVLPAFA
jgi:uncharacterized protein (DUF433 family)